MGVRLRIVGLTLAFALSACSTVAAQSPARAMPDWMSGYWLSCTPEGETVETWIGAGRDRLVGSNLSGGGFEFLRIAPSESGQITYYSMPDGRSPPTAFAMTSNTGQRAVFENPAHDFPKRIIYTRQGDVLTARIDAGEGSEQGMEWRFARAALDARCPA